MPAAFDLSRTFIHLRDGGDAREIPLTRSFWRATSDAAYDRVVGVVEFRSDSDLHADSQEVHPEADEVLVVLDGAVDLLLDEGEAERCVPLESGEAAIVGRGVWHRLLMRAPGRLLFINSRVGMRSQLARAPRR